MIDNFNLIYFCWDTIEIIINASKTMYELLWSNISILGFNVKVIYLLSGGAFIVLITAWLVKKIVPIA